jgi:hypothetical protein
MFLSLTAKELLVYLSTRSDDSLLGAIFVEQDQTIEQTIEQIKQVSLKLDK